MNNIDQLGHQADPVTGSPSVPVQIDGVATLIAIYAVAVLQSGGRVGVARLHCRVAVRQQLYSAVASFACEMACSMVNC